MPLPLPCEKGRSDAGDERTSVAGQAWRRQLVPGHADRPAVAEVLEEVVGASSCCYGTGSEAISQRLGRGGLRWYRFERGTVGKSESTCGLF